MVFIDIERYIFFRNKKRLHVHLMTDAQDDLTELHDAAKKLGLKLSWFQPKSRPHYDLFDSKVTLAKQTGITQLTNKEIYSREIEKWKTK